jgi:hypothetical protein
VIVISADEAFGLAGDIAEALKDEPAIAKHPALGAALLASAVIVCRADGLNAGDVIEVVRGLCLYMAAREKQKHLTRRHTRRRGGDPMAVRAKFRVTSITSYEGGSTAVKLVPVVSGSEENKRFYKYTPGGHIELSTINEEAAAQFAVGKEFYIDFAPADPS